MSISDKGWFGWRCRGMLAAVVLFVGSGLTFWLQPMVGRMLLPLYGGSASVWLVCLAAFQLLLLGGYGYAWCISKFPAGWQRVIHLLLLLAGVVWAWWGGCGGGAGVGGGERVVWALLGDIFRIAAGPFVLIAAGSTLVQAWLAAGAGARGLGVYRLYAWSNLGSFCGLFLYPLGLEPFVAVGSQRLVWVAVMVVYVVLLAVVALWGGRLERVMGGRINRKESKKRRKNRAEEGEQCGQVGEAGRNAYRTLGEYEGWGAFYLPALSAALLVAVTAQVTQQVIALPLVWALLLGCFLLSYVVGFREQSGGTLALWRGLALLLVAAAPLFYLRHANFMVGVAVLTYGVLLLFVVSAWLHSMLYGLRPATEHLPRYYFLIALGGAVGGNMATFLPPLLFAGVWELPLVLAAVVAVATRGTAGFVVGGWRMARLIEWLVVVALCGVVVAGWKAVVPYSGVLHRARDFYGAIAVVEVPVTLGDGSSSPMRQLVHGTVNHGQQLMRFGWEDRALSYFGSYSGAALAMESHPLRRGDKPMRVGVVGLGIGSLLAYGLPGDSYVCYEISRPVVRAAENQKWFTFVGKCLAEVTIKVGDGRTLLQGELRRGSEAPFDVLYLDAFSGDSPPFHLLTREAFALYLERLAPNGIIAMNITNWHLNFQPLCKAVAAEFGLKVDGFFTPNYPQKLQTACFWVLMSRVEHKYEPHEAVRRVDWALVPEVPLPSDAQGSALRYLGRAEGMLRSVR